MCYLWGGMARTLLLCALLVAAGCVERRLFLRSEPSGAEVVLNHGDFPPVTTPAVVDFTHYGTYAVRAEKEGCRPLETAVEIDTPWWAFPPLDFVTDLLWPFPLEDHREVRLTLSPLSEPPSVEEIRARHAGVLERAEAFRRRVNEGDPAEIR